MASSSSEPTDEERRPLLDTTFDSGKLLDLRSRAKKNEQLQDWVYVEHENMPGYVVAVHIFTSLVQVTVVLGAYFFIQSQGHNITPQCSVYYKSGRPWNSTDRWEEYMCFTSTFCFWTYPLVSPMVIIMLFYKNCLDKRIFYECLLNRIFLLQSSFSYLYSVSFWFLLLYFLTGSSCVFYMHNASPNSSYKELIFGMLAYLAPTAGFISVLFSRWSVSRLIVPLPLYVERDCPAAMALLSECTFIKEADFKYCFRHVEELCDQSGVALEFNTTEMMLLIQDIHQDRKHYASRESLWSKTTDVWSRLTYGSSWGGYWVYRFLFFPHLNDVRARRFKFFARIYHLFIFLATLLFIYAMVYTTAQLLVFQKAITFDLGVLLPAPHEVPDRIKNAPIPSESDVDDVFRRSLRIGSRLLGNGTARLLGNGTGI